MDGHPPESIRGLIFDVGDVLYDGSLWRRWLLKLLARMDIHKPYDDFYREWEREYYPRACLGQGDTSSVLRQYLADLGLCPGQVDEVSRAAGARERNGLNQPQPFFGVRRTLAYLKHNDFALAALSNTELTECDLRHRLAGMGLDEFFDVVVSSRNSGAVKPQPAAYRAVMDRWQLASDDVAFVGHDADELAGAAESGLATIALFHQPHVQACWRLDDFEQLCHLAFARPLARAA